MTVSASSSRVARLRSSVASSPNALELSVSVGADPDAEHRARPRGQSVQGHRLPAPPSTGVDGATASRAVRGGPRRDHGDRPQHDPRVACREIPGVHQVVPEEDAVPAGRLGGAPPGRPVRRAPRARRAGARADPKRIAPQAKAVVEAGGVGVACDRAGRDPGDSCAPRARLKGPQGATDTGFDCNPARSGARTRPPRAVCRRPCGAVQWRPGRRHRRRWPARRGERHDAPLPPRHATAPRRPVPTPRRPVRCWARPCGSTRR